MAPSLKAVVKSSWGFVSSALSSRRSPQASADGPETETTSGTASHSRKRNKLTKMKPQPPTPIRRRREDFGFPVLGSDRDREWEREIQSANPQLFRRTPGRVHFAPFVEFVPTTPRRETDDDDEPTAPNPADDAHAQVTEHPPSPTHIAISVFLEAIPEHIPRPAPTQPSNPLYFQDDYLTSHVFGPVPDNGGPLPAPRPYEISYEEARLSSIPYTPVSLEEQRLNSSPYTPFGDYKLLPLHTVSRHLVVEELNKDSFLPDAPGLVHDDSSTPSQASVPVPDFPLYFFEPVAAFQSDDQDIDLPDAPSPDAPPPDAPLSEPQTPIRQIARPLFVQTPAPHHPPFLPPSSEPATSDPVTPETALTNAPDPIPDSPGDERGTFIFRRNIEGKKFALELFKAIRNDHYMRRCFCGLPTIFASKDAAESGKGHLRFYVLDGNTLSITEDNLRVIQKKTDLQWHCNCVRPKELDVVYRKHLHEGDHINSRKRPAEDSEIELRAQAADEQPIAANEEPMWDFVTNRATAMTATIKTFLGNWCPRFLRDHVETVEVRPAPAANTASAQATRAGESIVVKRFKRQHALPLGTTPAVDLSEIPGLRWASDPRRYIGPANIDGVYRFYMQEFDDILEGKFRGASSTPLLWMQLEAERDSPDHNVIASINIHRTMEDMFGCVAFDSDEVRREKWLQARAKYEKNLITLISFIEEVYGKDVEFNGAKSRFPKPPINRRLGKVEFAQATGAAARFITWLLQGKSEWVTMSSNMLDTLAKMLADADAIHKHELVPSWVEYPGHNEEAGNESTGIIAPTILWDEIPIEQFKAEAGHEVRYPASMYPPTPAQPQLPNIVEDSPVPILKHRKVAFPEHVASPQYVRTPMKSRKLSFVNPIVKVARNTYQPGRVLKPAERKTLGKEGVKRAEDDLQLRQLHHKYGGLLQTLEDNVKLQKEFRRAMAARRPTPRAPRFTNTSVDIARPTPEDRVARDKRAQEMQRVYELKKNMSVKLAAFKENPALSPRTKDKVIRKPLLDTPEERRKFIEDNHIMPIPFEPKKIGRQPLNIDYAKEAARISAARIIKQEPTPDKTPGADISTKARRQFINDLVNDNEDGADISKEDPSMEISAKMQEDLELTQQMKNEYANSIALEIHTTKKREAAEKARLAAEAEAARLRAELAAAGGLRNPKVALITPLSQAWAGKVKNLGNANPRGELVKTPEGSLDRRDFVEMLLPSTAWLNDNIIISSIQYVAAAVNEAAKTEPQNPKCAAFTSYFYDRLRQHGPTKVDRMMRNANIRKANFLSIDTILIPICQHSHWTLAVVRPRDGIVAHIDSMRNGGGHKEVEDKIMEWVRVTLGNDFVADDWHVHQYKAPHQSNGYDCGVFTITNAVCQALGIKMQGAYNQQQLTLQRSRIAAMLLNGGWKGEFGLEQL
ncbi:hypothetical protein QBC39DRAFT_403997 [Podospora conica]|nr:hypothetical protein QBC39DRAFT_403997 [Schizothecium conicum]